MEDETIFVNKGKGSKDRVIPISPQLMPVLRSYNRGRRHHCPVSEWYFTGIKSSKKLGAKNIQSICQKISVASEIKFTPHMLRHTFGRLCVEAGISIYEIKIMMGHTSTSTTEIYLSISTQALKNNFGKAQLL